MYERFYGFSERPFSLLPDPDFLFLGDKHQTALDLLELTIFNKAGFCVVSGDIGAGKTTLIRELLNRLDEDICVGLISNTHPSFGELLQWVMAAFGLTCNSGDQFALHERFLDFVIQQYADNKRTLLIIDEAQNLSVSAMEELRMLSNVNSDKDLVLQIILVGQNQLRDKLQLPELEQFAQRIAVDHHLTGLDEKETCDYIRYRVTHAGGSADLFSEDSCRTVFRCSDGIPRLINGICDLCLVYGYSDKSLLITPELVREVVKDQGAGHIRAPAGKLTQQAGDVAMTAFASTLADGAGFVEQNSAARQEPEPSKTDMLVGQLPDSQGKVTTLEKAASQVYRNLASSGTAPETIVGSMERMLRQAPRPHRFVAEAEQAASSVNGQGMPAVFRLVMGLVLLMGAGATGWLTWLLWDEAPIADTVADHPSETAAPSTAVSAPVIDPLTQESANKRPEQLEAERLERERQAAKKRLAELQREAERLERERQAAEKRLAEQREAERLERERRAAEKRLAEQREAERLARERQAAEKRLAEQREAERLERERQAAEKRLVEQREAERELAKRPEAIRQANKISNNATQRIVPSVPKTRDRLYPDAELQAKRAAALEAWNKANSGMGWAEDIEGEDESD